MKVAIVPHSVECMHDTVVFHGNTLRICDDLVDDDVSRLRAHRQALGVSLRDVAAATGLSKGGLSQIETGKALPSIKTAYRLACYYETTIEALFSDCLEQDGVS